MSLREKHHKPHTKNAENLDRKIALMIAAALRADYGEQYSSIKQIAKHTDASLSTIKKWYEGRNPPNSCNLIQLARHSPSVLRVLMELVGKQEVWERYKSELSSINTSGDRSGNVPPPIIYPEESFGINVRIDFAVGNKLNARQLWFLGLLQNGHTMKAEHIAVTWQVTVRAGEADIAGLVKAKLIHFVGAKKTGRYEIILGL